MTGRVGKAIAILSLILLPLAGSLWYRSHTPTWSRSDVTPYKSMWVYLNNGICTIEILDMPTSIAGKSEFAAPLTRDPRPIKASILMTSRRHGPYRTTWIVFPLWLVTATLALLGSVPLAYGPVLRFIRVRRGCCIECGYNLYGNRSGRCSECGTPFASPGRRSVRRAVH